VPKTYFTHREFSFTLKDDIYIRYLSFADLDEFEKELQKRCPYKIDIGAVFSHRVCMYMLCHCMFYFFLQVSTYQFALMWIFMGHLFFYELVALRFVLRDKLADICQIIKG